MDKMRMESKNNLSDNISRLSVLFPNCITETKDESGTTKKTVNFELLKQMLSDDVVDGQECYEFSWVGKRAAIVETNKPIRKTLRPCKEESVNWDTTENLYIEGDNLEVIKLLQESYLGKVKMIYIDPPYNTGNDFIYNDDFKTKIKDYELDSLEYNDDGERLYKNTESNGRFHSDWCSMMYSRLLLARNLLTDDGIVFISIDDNEATNLRAICDEVFGGENALIPFIWPLPRGINAGLIARAHEYIIGYCKNINCCKNFNRVDKEIQYSIDRCNKKIDSRHPESSITFPAGVPCIGEDKVLTGVIEGSEKITIHGEMIFKNGKLDKPVTLSAGWTMKNMIEDWLNGKDVYDLKGQRIEGFFFKDNGKLYSKKEMSTLSIKSILKDIPDTQIARKEIESLFGTQDIFSYPKTIELPKLLAKLTTTDGDIVMDFFSGSGTTGHALMKLNSEEQSRRKFILVQIPERCNKESVAANMGLNTICEIGKERLRRAGTQLIDTQPLVNNSIDIGFRVLKLDDTNMNSIYYSSEEYSQDLLSMTQSSIKADRTDLDLLFGCLLEWGLPLSLPYTSEILDGSTIHTYNEGDLIACFDEGISENVIKEIAKRKPLRVVFRDDSFKDSPAKINVAEIFKLLSPDTHIKVL